MKKNLSAIKKARQSEKRRKRNSQVKSRMKTEIKKVLEALPRKDPKEIEELFRNAVRHIYKAASKGVIHKNKAARKVARLSKKVREFLNVS